MCKVLQNCYLYGSVILYDYSDTMSVRLLTAVIYYFVAGPNDIRTNFQGC